VPREAEVDVNMGIRRCEGIRGGFWEVSRGRWGCEVSRLPQYQDKKEEKEGRTASGPGNHCNIVKFNNSVGVHVYLFL
jgi:hypothetical protein